MLKVRAGLAKKLETEIRVHPDLQRLWARQIFIRGLGLHGATLSLRSPRRYALIVVDW